MLADPKMPGALEVADESWFVYVNHHKTIVKVLSFDGGGYRVWAKRLEAGRLKSNFPNAPLPFPQVEPITCRRLSNTSNVTAAGSNQVGPKRP